MAVREPRVNTLSNPAVADAPAHALSSSLPGFDLASARRRLGGNDRLLVELLQTFVAEHARCASEVERFIAESKPATAAALLHRVKSAARIVGAQNVADAAQAAEHAIRHGQQAEVAAFAGALADAVAQIDAHFGLAQRSSNGTTVHKS